VRRALALSITAHLALLVAAVSVPAHLALPLAAAPLSVRIVDTTPARSPRAAAPVATASDPRPATRSASPPIKTTAMHAPVHAAAPVAAETDAPTITASPASAAPVTGDRVNHLRTLLTAALAAHFHYPRLARIYGWQGRVQVDVRVESDGRVHPLRVARSSGHSLLDRHALDTLSRIGTVPALAHRADGAAVDFEVPIEYRLIDGQS